MRAAAAVTAVTAVAVALGLAGCGSDERSVVVHVGAAAEAPISGIKSFHGIAAAAATSSRVFDVDLGGRAPATLPPALSFAVVVPAQLAGDFTVVLEARDAGGIPIAHGDGRTSIFASRDGSVDVTLQPGRLPSGGVIGACDPNGADDYCAIDLTSLWHCRSDGNQFDNLPCANGCSSSDGHAHCQHVSPAMVAAPDDYGQATARADIASETIFDTDVGSISGGLTRAAGGGVVGGIYFREVTQAGTNVKVGLYGFAGLSVAATGKIYVKGHNALAIVSSADVIVDGIIDVTTCEEGTNPSAGGAGGAAPEMPASGDGAGGVGTVKDGHAAGGSGGGHGDVGGIGAAPLSTDIPGGALFGASFAMSGPLVGGGGGGGGAIAGAGAGGHGGGALLLSVDARLTVGGSILANGCGGGAGGAGSGGGGGGAGGAIMLEAASVVLKLGSVVTANGGSGGGGNGGAPGVEGRPDRTAAPGGISQDGGNGGLGGVAGSVAGGAAEAEQTTHGGGGGGAVGRIAVRTAFASGWDQGVTLSPDTYDRNRAGQPPATGGATVFR